MLTPTPLINLGSLYIKIGKAIIETLLLHTATNMHSGLLKLKHRLLHRH